LQFLLRVGLVGLVVSVACVTSDAAFAQAGNAAPPAPAPPSGAPATPEGGAPVLPPGEVRPPLQFSPMMRGSDCESERSPGTGV
jgi:hypothetical protein